MILCIVSLFFRFVCVQWILGMRNNVPPRAQGIKTHPSHQRRTDSRFYQRIWVTLRLQLPEQTQSSCLAGFFWCFTHRCTSCTTRSGSDIARHLAFFSQTAFLHFQYDLYFLSGIIKRQPSALWTLTVRQKVNDLTNVQKSNTIFQSQWD